MRVAQGQMGLTVNKCSRPRKSFGFRVYNGRSFAAAVAAINKSARRERAVRPDARTAEKTRPNMRAASLSNGSGSQVLAAQCSRSCRRARSFSSSVACGPAASSASVIAATAHSAGSNSASIRSRSITTEVSSRPWCAPTSCASTVGDSAINGLVYDFVHIVTELFGVDPHCACRRLGDGGAGCKTSWLDRSQLGNRLTVTGNGNGLSGLHFPKHLRGEVTQVSLIDGLVHAKSVAHVSRRSNMAAGVAPVSAAHPGTKPPPSEARQSARAGREFSGRLSL